MSLKVLTIALVAMSTFTLPALAEDLTADEIARSLRPTVPTRSLTAPLIGARTRVLPSCF